MVAYYFSFKTALVKGSPNVVSPNTSVLIYDVLDVNRVTPVTAYADPALTTITNLVSDQYGIVPDFYTDNRPDILWKSGTFKGQWATSQSRPGIRGATGPQGPQGIQGPIGIPGLNGAGTNAEVAAYIPSSGPTRDALDARYPTKDAQAAALAGKVDKGELVISSADRGVVSSGSIDNSAAIQTLLNDGKKRRAIMQNGYFIASGLVINDPVKFEGNGADFARFAGGTNNDTYNAVQITAKAGATTTLLRVNSYLTTVQGGLVFSGANEGNLGLAVTKGFQFRHKNCGYVSFASTAIDYSYLANAVIEDIFVDNSGSLTKPAVIVRSGGIGSRTNNARFNRLTIERSQNTALAIGTIPSGDTPDIDKHWAEWVYFDGIHIEAALDNGGIPNTGPVIDIGNVRNVWFSGGQVYGGPGPLLRHTQTLNRTFGNGGITVNGGFWLGSDTGAGAPATPYLFDLVTGDNFTITGGAVLDRYTTAAIRIGASYGPNVTIDPSVLATGVLVEDNRPIANRKPYTVTGDFKVSGRVSFSGAVPSYVSVAGSGFGLSGLADNNSTRGTLRFGSGTDGTKLTAGSMIGTVTFNPARTAKPYVYFVPKNLKSAQLGSLFVNPSTTGFNIYLPQAIPTNEAVTNYEYDYLVIG